MRDTAKTTLHAACCPEAGDTVIPPGTLRGRRAVDLLEEISSPHALRRAVGIATLNALADACWQRCPHPEIVLREEMDAFDAAAIVAGEHVVLVGAFIPFLRALKRMGQDYTVLELNPTMLKPDEVPHFRPGDAAADVIPRGDVVLLTGSTLLNGTLEDLLLLAVRRRAWWWWGRRSGCCRMRSCAVAWMCSGGVRVTAPDAFLDVLAEGGSGQHFFGRSASRVALLRRSPKQDAVGAA